MPYATIAFVLATESQLPNQKVATHFGMDGAPNGWMTARGYTLFIMGMDLFMLLIPTGIFLGVRRIPLPGAGEWPITGEAAMVAVAIVFTWVQLLMGFIALDAYWFNVRDEHIAPIDISVAAVLATVALLIPAIIIYVVLQGRRRPSSKAPG